MIWKLIKNKIHTGQYNMDYDIELAKNCNKDEAYLRFYQWQPYCISLGANQKFEDINIDFAKKNDIDIVKRPTGGRAILHAEELTYSVVYPLNGSLSNKEIYTKISLALVNGLKSFDPLLEKVELENIQPDFPDLLSQPSGVLCFASTAKSEVKFSGKKLIGSAQRKMENVVLQHGSILCGDFHNRLPDYLNADSEILCKLKKELSEKTIDIQSITNKTVDYSILEDHLVEGFVKEWEIDFLKGN